MHMEEEVTHIPKKRQRRLELHQRNIAKEMVQRGKEHRTASGRIVAAKQFQEQTKCKCRRDCSKQIDIVRQKEIFDSYYCAPNWTEKTLFIGSSVTQIASPKNKKRKLCFQYSLDDADGVSRQVCREFYVKCLSVVPSRVRRAISTLTKNPSAAETRGRAAPINKTPDQDRKNAINFIKLLPNYELYYRRKTSQSEHPKLNLKKLYGEYKSFCESKKENTVSYYVFGQICHNNFPGVKKSEPQELTDDQSATESSSSFQLGLDVDGNNKDIQDNSIHFVKQIPIVKNCALPSRTCGLIEVTLDNTHSYTLNCIHCAEKFSIMHWTSFLVHMNEKHPTLEQGILNTDDLQNDNTLVDKENGLIVIQSNYDAPDKIEFQQNITISKDIKLAAEVTVIKSELDLNHYEIIESNVIPDYNNASESENYGQFDCNSFICEKACNNQNAEFRNSVEENVISETYGSNRAGIKEHRKPHKRLKLLDQNKLLLDFGAKDNIFESSYKEEFKSISTESGKKLIELEDDIKALEVTDQRQVNEAVNVEFDATNIKIEEFLDL